MKKTTFKLKSGNTPMFKHLGSSILNTKSSPHKLSDINGENRRDAYNKWQQGSLKKGLTDILDKNATANNISSPLRGGIRRGLIRAEQQKASIDAIKKHTKKKDKMEQYHREAVSGFKQTPLKQKELWKNIKTNVKDFKKEISNNPITRSKAWQATKPARKFVGKWGGRALGWWGVGAYEAGKSIHTLATKGPKETGAYKTAETMKPFFRVKNWGKQNKNKKQFNILSPDPFGLKGPEIGSKEWENQFKN